MSDLVDKYMGATQSLQKYFNCTNDYFIKPLPDFNWSIYGDEGIFFLTYWNKDNDKVNAVIVKKDNKPLIYKTEDYTMVVALDCIKIAFILKNKKEHN